MQRQRGAFPAPTTRSSDSSVAQATASDLDGPVTFAATRSSPETSTARRGVRVGRRAALPLLGAVFAALMLGGTLPVPLYALWAPKLGFGALTTTLIFAAYTIGTIVALLTLANLSDQAGRRPMLLAAIATVAASTVLFALADSVVILLLARLLSGVAAGVVTATATAALAELDDGPSGSRSARAATLANMGGLGLGPIIAGVLAQSVANPTSTIFWVYLLLLVPAVAAVWLLPETVGKPHRPRVRLHRPLIPAGAGRTRFLTAATLTFVAFSILGLFSSLVPAFLGDVLNEHNLAIVGLIVGLIFLTAAITQLAISTERARAGLATAPLILIVGLAGIEGGLWAESLGLFLVGTVASGVGVALAFKGGLTVVHELADPAHRAGLTATFFLSAYAGLTIPTVTVGVLNESMTARSATLIVAGVVGLLALLAVALDRRTAAADFRRDLASANTSTTSA
jgi:MFS family permease